MTIPDHRVTEVPSGVAVRISQSTRTQARDGPSGSLKARLRVMSGTGIPKPRLAISRRPHNVPRWIDPSPRSVAIVRPGRAPALALL